MVSLALLLWRKSGKKNKKQKKTSDRLIMRHYRLDLSPHQRSWTLTTVAGQVNMRGDEWIHKSTTSRLNPSYLSIPMTVFVSYDAMGDKADPGTLLALIINCLAAIPACHFT